MNSVSALCQVEHLVVHEFVTKLVNACFSRAKRWLEALLGGMNMKGVFTRACQPKMAAHVLREFWAK